MNGRGLSPRARRVGWILVALLVAAVLVGTAGGALERIAGWVRDEHDRLPWYATRLFALLAWLALTASVVWGLLLSTGILDAIAHRAVSFTLHQDLSGVGLALAIVHAAILMIDRAVPYSPLEVLVPFSGSYRPLWVGIGQVALWLVVVVFASFYVRKRIGQKRWRTLHYAAFLAFVTATAHGLMAGTDTGSSLVWWAYVAASALTVFLLGYRIALAVLARVAPEAPAPTTRSPRTVTAAPAATPPTAPAAGSPGA